MLPEQPATAYERDPSSAAVLVASAASRPTLGGDVPARLLLDDASHLVGVDVAPDAPERLVVMLGPHEKVTRVEEVVVRVEGDGATVRIEGKAAAFVTPGANPYVG